MIEIRNSHKNSRSNKRKSKEKPTNTCSENTNQYLVNSTLHGLRYVGDRNISYFERYLLMVVFEFFFLFSNFFSFKDILWTGFHFRYNFVGIFHIKYLG